MDRERQEPDRIVRAEPMCLLGLARRLPYAHAGAVGAQWSEFAPRISGIAHRVGDAAFGAVTGFDPLGFDYLAGVAVEPGSEATSTAAGTTATAGARLTALDVPALAWAVFAHAGPVTTIAATCASIQAGWGVGRRAVWPGFLERYGPGFDARAGSGDIEIWMPAERLA